MNIIEAQIIIGDRATWELKAMIKALSFCELLNTDKDSKRLQACKIILSER